MKRYFQVIPKGGEFSSTRPIPEGDEINNALELNLNSEESFLDCSPQERKIRDDARKQPRVDIELNDLESDTGLRKKISSYHPNDQEKVRRAYILNGPCQPNLTNFPYSNDGGKQRRFNRAWYNEFKEWLEYSKDKDAAFCLPCYLFKPDIGEQSGGDKFIGVGFRKWKKKVVLNEHAKSETHYQAWMKYVDLLNQGQHIETALCKQSKQVTEEYRLRLNASIERTSIARS